MWWSMWLLAPILASARDQSCRSSVGGAGSSSGVVRYRSVSRRLSDSASFRRGNGRCIALGWL
jgi:hypothetical protein